ncbi:MAG: PAS domain S-box protein [Magnetococcales bacterium]|nr:PAS domain S-box protein [Nitrospirota bacterium]
MPVIFALTIFAGLYIVSLYNYLVFHSLIELFGVVLSLCIFVFTWNLKHLLKNNFFIFLGVACLFIGTIELMHMIAYKGLGIFPGQGANLPTQFWIAARYTEALSILAAFFVIDRRVNWYYLVAIYAGITTCVLLSILRWNIFPVCYVDGSGLTQFKKGSEYVISMAFIISAILVRAKSALFAPDIYRLILASIILAIAAELVFTLYIGVYDFFNLIGHYLKLISSYLIFKAIVEVGLVEPYKLAFADLLESREQLNKLSKAVEQTTDLIVITDKHGIVQYANPAFETASGFSIQEVVGRNLRIVKSGIHGVEFYANLWDTILKGKVFQATFVNRKKDGVLYYEDKTITPVTSEAGAITHFVSIGRDITERKRVESELMVRSDELARSNAELEQFASVTSHDIMEPLRMAKNYAELLSNKYGRQMDPTGTKYIGYILHSVQRIRVLITDILTVSRIDSQGRQFRDVHLGNLLNTVALNLKAAIEETGTVITSDDLGVVRGDETQLLQLFQQLIGNSIKFRSEKPPQIHIGAMTIDSNQDKTYDFLRTTDTATTLFCVKDNGIGIENQYHEKIFAIFQRLHGRDKYDGTGIGLSICKKIVQRHGGKIWVESADGNGSAFYFTIST